jgi:inositol oxygenase
MTTEVLTLPPTSNEFLSFGKKSEQQFRVYHHDTQVAQTYRLNHKNQTFEFVLGMHKKYHKFDKVQMSIWDAIKRLEAVIDESDPDTALPQIVHSLQTAEGLRSAYPDIEWLPLVGLLHDLGKVIALPEFGNEPQWCVVGDTFPVGCAFDKSIVFHEFFSENPDNDHPTYSTLYGIYEPNCGLDKLNFSYGHDEYMYQCLKYNQCLIPEEGLRILRFHSFYPWHREGAYQYFMNEDDQITLKWTKVFSKMDLYTKDAPVPDVEKLMPYYINLVKKYFPNEILSW